MAAAAEGRLVRRALRVLAEMPRRVPVAAVAAEVSPVVPVAMAETAL